MSEPKFELMRLFERVSATSGKTYFSGRLGGASVVVFKDERADPRYGSMAEWQVMVSAVPSDQSYGKRKTPSAGKPESDVERERANDRSRFNDDIPF